jgi:hypothetical protein
MKKEASGYLSVPDVTSNIANSISLYHHIEALFF